MPRPVPTLTEKLIKEELKLKELIILRHQQIMNIFDSCKAFTIDDSLLAGFLLFAMDKSNEGHQILKDFTVLAKNENIPGKPKQVPKKRVGKT